MGGTSIKRKALRNRLKSKMRKSTIKLLTRKPVQKNVDIEELKADFVKPTKAEPKTEKTVEEVVEVKAEEKAEEVKEEKKEKKSEAKAKTTKAKAKKPEDK